VLFIFFRPISDSTRHHFVHCREDLDDLTTQILNMKQGTQYYVPLAGDRASRS
jgi:hypothetical protein